MTARPEKPYLTLASICALRAGTPQVVSAVEPDCPIWLDFNLHTDPALWVQPWVSLRDKPVRWHGFDDAREQLRGAGRFGETEEQILRALPDLNELGVLRALKRSLDSERVTLFPLAGFIPTKELRRDPNAPPADEEDERSLEFALLRVNLAVTGDLMMTVRLPDRLCSGSRASRDGERRLPFSVSGRVPPDLTVFPHLLSSGQGSGAEDMADALALYLSATSVSVAEYVRGALFPIESDVRNSLNGGSDSDVAEANDSYREVFDMRMTLSIAEEEMRRLLQRLAEADFGEGDTGRGVELGYRKALEEICTLEQDLRIAGDGLAQQLEQERKEKDEERHKQVSTLIGVLGVILIVPALVISLFDENAKLPSPNVIALALMIALIFVVGWGFGLLIGWLVPGAFAALRERLPGWLTRVTGAS